MKTFFKSRLFLTKVIPALYFCIFGLVYLSGIFFGKTGVGISTDGVIVFSIAAIVLLNLLMRKYWISYVIGITCFLIFFYFILAVLSEYREFSNLASYDALLLLIVGLLLCFSGIAIGILLMIPFKKTQQSSINVELEAAVK